MSEAIISVLIASSSAVAKVFVIGAIGYLSAIRPKDGPILPESAMNAISKMNFNLLIIPLVYSALASGVTPSALGSLWVVLISGIGVICLSYFVATVLGKLPFFKVENKTDFDALRIAASFPNIVALPILIFPTLCEFPVVYNAFYEGEDEISDAEKYKSCADESNAMIFVYFFAWNLLYWIIGYSTLVAAGKRRQMKNADKLSLTQPHNSHSDSTEAFDNEQLQVNIEGDSQQSNITTTHSKSDDIAVSDVEENKTEDIAQYKSETRQQLKSLLQLFTNAIKQTLKSPGFVAMVLGVITACIPPLRDVLFETGGSLRFLGSALESLGRAGASVGTLVVAASLVHQANADESKPAQITDTEVGTLNATISATNAGGSTNFRDSMRRKRSSLSRLSTRVMNAIKIRKASLRMHCWFTISRLIVTPAIVCLLIITGNCSGILDRVPSLAKLVVIVNSCLPGAQLIVLTLKSRGLSDSASIVAQVYLPSYLLSVVTIAAWTSLGLIISTPKNEDGSSFCRR